MLEIEAYQLATGSWIIWQTPSLVDWSKDLSISVSTIRRRIKYGIPIKIILSPSTNRAG